MATVTHNVVVSEDRDGQRYFTKVGVAMTTANGHLLLKLHPGTNLSWQMTRKEDIAVWLMSADGRRGDFDMGVEDLTPVDESDIPF